MAEGKICLGAPCCFNVPGQFEIVQHLGIGLGGLLFGELRDPVKTSALIVQTFEVENVDIRVFCHLPDHNVFVAGV